MALTKKDIIEQVYNELGFPRNQSIEVVESLLELMKSTWHLVTMSWFQGSENSA